MQNSFTSFRRKPTLPSFLQSLTNNWAGPTIIMFQGATLRSRWELRTVTKLPFVSFNICTGSQYLSTTSALDLAWYGVCEKLNWSYLPLSEVCGWQVQNTEAVSKPINKIIVTTESFSSEKNNRELFDPRLCQLFIHKPALSVRFLIRVMKIEMMSAIRDLFISHKNPRARLISWTVEIKAFVFISHNSLNSSPGVMKTVMIISWARRNL